MNHIQWLFSHPDIQFFDARIIFLLVLAAVCSVCFGIGVGFGRQIWFYLTEPDEKTMARLRKLCEHVWGEFCVKCGKEKGDGNKN